MDINIEMIFGAILVIIYAIERFNTPTTIRSTTTAGRYYFASFIYMTIYISLFLLFTLNPQLLEVLLAAFGSDESLKGTVESLKESSTPIFIAILLSLLIPKFPVVSQLDIKLRLLLHRLANIPSEAMRLSNEIQNSEYHPPQADQEKIIERLEEQGFPVKDIDIDSDDLIIRKWICITSLLVQLRGWERSRQFSSFVQERGGQFERIKERYKQLSLIEKNAFDLFHQAKKEPKLEALQDADSKLRESIRSEEKLMFSEICDFICHGVLKCCFRFDSRKKTLVEMGV